MLNLRRATATDASPPAGAERGEQRLPVGPAPAPPPGAEGAGQRRPVELAPLGAPAAAAEGAAPGAGHASGAPGDARGAGEAGARVRERREAIADIALVGPSHRGDEVIVNVEALDLGLGSGGFDVVHANLTRG